MEKGFCLRASQPQSAQPCPAGEFKFHDPARPENAARAERRSPTWTFVSAVGCVHHSVNCQLSLPTLVHGKLQILRTCIHIPILPNMPDQHESGSNKYGFVELNARPSGAPTIIRIAGSGMSTKQVTTYMSDGFYLL